MQDTLPVASVPLSRFAKSLASETAFDVLAVAKRLKAGGKDVIELQIGDSPFPTTANALAAGIQAINDNATHYCPSGGLLSFRQAVAANYMREFGVPVTAANVVVAPGAKVFEQFFCEAFLNPGDAVLVFSPHFPTYGPNIERRGGRVVCSTLRQENAFRPNLGDVEHFVRSNACAKAIFLNSPHNPTGGVATPEDMKAIADQIRGTAITVFSDEPYCHMAWQGEHRPFLAQPGMMHQAVAAYTFSKSYSMSGWRLGYAVSSPGIVETISKLINTSLSCVPPFVQLAGQAALERDAAERDDLMQRFRKKVEMLVTHLQRVRDVAVLMPAGTFYVFPDVSAICNRLGIKSHGLAMYLLEGADDDLGVACLGGECFGPAGQGFLRFSCAEPDDRLQQAVTFFAEALTRTSRVEAFLKAHAKYRLHS
jgi:aspartate aminotransferase